MTSENHMTSCHELRDYLLERLDDAGRSTFEAHLGSCAGCREEVAAWERVDGAVQRWSDARPVPETSPFVANRLIQVAREGRQPKITRRVRSPLALVAATAIAAVIAVVLVLQFTGDKAPAEDTPSTQIEPVLVHAEGGEIRLDRQTGEAALTVAEDGHLLAALQDDRIALGSRSDARLTRPERGGLRIELKRGTVAVHAAKREPGSPMVVVAGDCRVEVVGTRFSVHLTGNEAVEVAVGEGRVRVIDGDGISRFVTRGQSLTLGSGAERIAALHDAQAKEMDELLALPPSEEPAPIEEPAPEVTPAEPLADESADSAQSDSPAARPRPDDEKTDLGKVKRWILSGELDRAEAVLEPHLRRHPRDVKAWNLLANCRRKAGNFGDAVTGYRKVIEYGGAAESNRARFVAATVLQDHMSRHGEAAALLEAYLERPAALKPLESEAMVRLARALLRTGRSAEAHDLLQEVLDRFPGTTAALQARRLLPAE